MQQPETVGGSATPTPGDPEGDCLLSVVIPAFNEAQRIEGTMERVLAYFQDIGEECEIIVVIDGGTDETPQILERIASGRTDITVLTNDRNRGKGYSVRRGILHARGQFVLFSDADLSTPIEEATRLLAELEEGYAVAIGSRALEESDIEVAQPWWRRSMGRMFNHVVRGLGLSRFRDTQCGFKAFTRAAARDIFSRARLDGFAFDVEALCIAIDQGYPISELPVKWRNSPESRVRPVRDSMAMFLDLVRIRARLLWERWVRGRSPRRTASAEPLPKIRLQGPFHERRKQERQASDGCK
jgi:dolichyl-phosphate beta-glucosyltransferase